MKEAWLSQSDDLGRIGNPNDKNRPPRDFAVLAKFFIEFLQNVDFLLVRFYRF